MTRFRPLLLLPAALALLLAACGRPFIPARIQPNERLFQASLAEFQKERWQNAILGFERLTLNLPARDTLLPLSHYYLGMAHIKKGENLLGAQALQRLTEAFPNDTLADDALYEAGKAYGRLWRKPVLDSQYGQLAMTTLRTLLALYPSTPLREPAEREIARLDQWFGRKDYEIGMHYLRRRAFDSAIIYFRDVIRQHPDAPVAREAHLRLAQAYRAINYREEMREVCATMHTRYPGDSEVRELCGAAPATVSTPTP